MFTKLAAGLLGLAMLFAILFGAQPQAWSWGSSGLCILLALMLSIQPWWRKETLLSNSDRFILVLGFLLLGWMLWCIRSADVQAYALMDGFLVFAATSTFLIQKAIARDEKAGVILYQILSVLVVASTLLIGIQYLKPGFALLLQTPPNAFPSGFFRHYSYGANFLSAASLLVLSAALIGKYHKGLRVLWFLIATAGLCAVVLTKSKGGIIGAGLGVIVLWVLWLIHAKRNHKRWFWLALVTTCSGIVVLCVGVIVAINHVEVSRGASDFNTLLDSRLRFYLMGIAPSCIELHPWTGGGPKSFSWESLLFLHEGNQVIDGGVIAGFAHNEWLQMACDYGIIGLVLVILFVFLIIMTASVRYIFSEEKGKHHSYAWCAGGLSALFAILLQCSVEGVFQLLPGAMMLGLVLAAATNSEAPKKGSNAFFLKGLISLVAVLFAVTFLLPSWRGIRITKILFPSHFSPRSILTLNEQLSILNQAVAIDPQISILDERADLKFRIAQESGKKEDFQAAYDDFILASSKHPKNPKYFVNAGNLAVRLRQYVKGQELLLEAVELQGSLESAYQGHFSLAKAYYHHAERLNQAGLSLEAFLKYQLAIQQFHEVEKKWGLYMIYNGGFQMKRDACERMAYLAERLGDPDLALSALDDASKDQGSSRCYYLAGMLMTRQALVFWRKGKLGEALYLLLEAQKRTHLAADLPIGIDNVKRLAFLDGIQQRINILLNKGLKPIPVSSIQFKR